MGTVCFIILPINICKDTYIHGTETLRRNMNYLSNISLLRAQSYSPVYVLALLTVHTWPQYSYFVYEIGKCFFNEHSIMTINKLAFLVPALLYSAYKSASSGQIVDWNSIAIKLLKQLWPISISRVLLM